jgi:hypothetical protein
MNTESSSTFNIALEPLVDAIFIEPGYSPTLAGLFDSDRISVPQSTATARHYIHLRPDDTINFSEDGLKISVMTEIPDSTSSPQPSSDTNINVADRHQGEIQVISSNVNPVYGEGDNATDTSDDDLDQTVTSHAAKLPPGEVTPTVRRTEQTVMETPQATTLTNLPPYKENTLYSTAQEAPTSDTVPLNQADGDSPAPSQTMELGTSNESPSSLDPAATSEPLQIPEVARAAASHSMGSHSSKRKITTVEEDEDGEEEIDEDTRAPIKKQKLFEPKVVREQRDYDEEMPDALPDGANTDAQATPSIDGISIEKSEERSDAEDAGAQEDIKPASKGKKGRPAKSTRRKTKSTSPIEPFNSSPTVVVAAQRSTKKRVPTSMSPPSSTTSSVLTGKVPNILLSNDSPCRKGTTAAFLKQQGATIIDDVKTRRAHFVCVLNGDRLTTTAKVLRSLALGKSVVTEDWITQSKQAGKFLDPDDFVHDDLKENIHVDRRAIFQNTNLFFTQTLAKGYGKGWKDIQELAKEAGASHVDEGSSGDFGTFKEGRMDVICFGQAKNDPDVLRLKKSHGVKVYHKNLLTESIRKGELDLDMEEHVL